MNAMAVNPEFVECKTPEGVLILVNRTLIVAVRDLHRNTPLEAGISEDCRRNSTGTSGGCYLYQYDGHGMYLCGSAKEMALRLGVIVNLGSNST